VNPDHLDLLRTLCAAEARYLTVGTYAVAYHGIPYSSDELELWVEPSLQNARRVWGALRVFGAPMEQITIERLSTTGVLYWLGLPPRRIVLCGAVRGLEFEDAWKSRAACTVGGVPCMFIDRNSLIAHKRLLGRPQDLADVQRLGQSIGW